MQRHIRSTVSAMLACLVLAGCQQLNPCQHARRDGWSHYGMADKDWGPTATLGAVSGGESNVIVAGTIVDACAKKGCWMRVADGDDELFVRFQDYSFFVPKNAAGHRVVMHGTAVAQINSVEELRHYAEDARKSDQEIAAITEPEMRVTFFADSVYIQGDDLQEPHIE